MPSKFRLTCCSGFLISDVLRSVSCSDKLLCRRRWRGQCPLRIRSRIRSCGLAFGVDTGQAVGKFGLIRYPLPAFLILDRRCHRRAGWSQLGSPCRVLNECGRHKPLRRLPEFWLCRAALTHLATIARSPRPGSANKLQTPDRPRAQT